MAMLHPRLLAGVDETLGWQIISAAKAIAPLIDRAEGDDLAEVVAVLMGIAGEAAQRGSRQVAAQRVGTASVNYTGVADRFTKEDRDSLRAIGNRLGTSSTGPVGSFPPPSRVVSHLWPDDHHRH